MAKTGERLIEQEKLEAIRELVRLWFPKMSINGSVVTEALKEMIDETH